MFLLGHECRIFDLTSSHYELYPATCWYHVWYEKDLVCIPYRFMALQSLQPARLWDRARLLAVQELQILTTCTCIYQHQIASAPTCTNSSSRNAPSSTMIATFYSQFQLLEVSQRFSPHDSLISLHQRFSANAVTPGQPMPLLLNLLGAVPKVAGALLSDALGLATSSCFAKTTPVW